MEPTAAAPRPTGDAVDPPGDHVDGLLAQWERQRPGLDTSLLAVTARLVRIGRYLDRDATEHLAPFGLHEGEVNVLAALRRAGPPHVLSNTLCIDVTYC